jgi:membrane-bound serine protease (ClpP class)
MRQRYKTLSLCLLIMGTWSWVLGDVTAAEEGVSGNPGVLLVDLDGPVGPASVDLIIRTIDDANEQGREAVILRMNTPGGLDKAMRDLVQVILASNVPVITYVAPNGARAASAGTYIAYASHIAAMAPATNIGSSTPVSIAPQGLPTAPAGQPPGRQPDTAADEPGQDGDGSTPPAAPPADAMGRKVVNDAVAYLQSLAELRGRNIEWAERTVREGANLRASEALDLNVVDLIAADLGELLQAVHGRSVDVRTGSRTLNTAGAAITVVETDWRHDLLATITDPSIAYGLLIIGIYALILEFYNPGLIVPAVTGIILILLGAYGLQLLPVNYAGVGLVLLGVILMIIEVVTPTLGILGVAGLVSFVLGSMIMFDSDVPGVGLPIGIIAAFAVATGVTIFFVVGMAMRARSQKIVSGTEAMLGATGEALGEFEQAHDQLYHGDVRAFGEIWQARSNQPITAGDKVVVQAVDGLVLEVSEET